MATDIYLESVLARRSGARLPELASVPSTELASVPSTEPTPAIRLTADLLDRVLPRFRPSFGFEERLAGRLRSEAAGAASIAPGELVAFPGAVPLSNASVDASDRRARSLLVGGAIASGVSIAGAALLAWRRGRASGVPSGMTGGRAI
ncbi:MAG: hypothetical protein M3395_07360 [Chloroflexota bacterium]|nr:hypothetical protein [Chloroflexota bacterium]